MLPRTGAHGRNALPAREIGQLGVWSVVQPTLVVYSILPFRVRYVIHGPIGRSQTAVVVSDRYAGYAHIDPSRRQMRWAECGRQVC